MMGLESFLLVLKRLGVPIVDPPAVSAEVRGRKEIIHERSVEESPLID